MKTRGDDGEALFRRERIRNWTYKTREKESKAPRKLGATRIDMTCKSGAYTNIANIAKEPDVTNVNVTPGIQTSRFSLHAHATNLFNSKAYYSVGDSVLINLSFAHFSPNSALNAQLRELRTFGLHGSGCVAPRTRRHAYSERTPE